MRRGSLTGIIMIILAVLFCAFSTQAMENTDFYDLVYKLGELSSDYPKISLIKNNTLNETVTADQIALLLEYIKNVDERLYLLEELVPFIEDPENSVSILYSFKDIPSRNKAIPILKSIPVPSQETETSKDTATKDGSSSNTNTTDVQNSSNAENNVVININMSSENQNKNDSGSSGQPAQNVKAPMDQEKFQSLILQLNGKYYDEEKLDLLELAIPNKYFTSWQVINILKTIYYSSSQLDALRLLASKISDPENKHTIIDVFHYSSDKKEAKDILMNI